LAITGEHKSSAPLVIKVGISISFNLSVTSYPARVPVGENSFSPQPTT